MPKKSQPRRKSSKKSPVTKKEARAPQGPRRANEKFPTFVFTLSIVILALILLVALAYRIGLSPERFSMPAGISSDHSAKSIEAEVDDYIAELEAFYKELEVDVLADDPDPESENFLKSAGLDAYESDLDLLKSDLQADDDLFATEPEF